MHCACVEEVIVARSNYYEKLSHYYDTFSHYYDKFSHYYDTFSQYNNILSHNYEKVSLL